MYSTYSRARSYLFKLFDSSSGTIKERTKYYATFIKSLKGSLLDIGCGDGLLFDFVKNPGQNHLLVGLDLTKNNSRKYCHVESSATKLPFKSGSFSFITAFSLLEHIPEDQRDEFYKDIHRTLEEGGTLLIQLPNRYALIESHSYLPLFGFLPSRLHTFAYKGQFTSMPSLKTVIQSLTKNGFVTYEIKNHNAPFLPFGHLLEKLGFFKIFPMGYFLSAIPNKVDD